MDKGNPSSRFPASAGHGSLLRWLIASYLVAAIFPGPGLWLRGLSLGQIDVLGGQLNLRLPMVLLSLLLFNAGLGVAPTQLRGLFHRPLILLAGLLANLLVPLTVLLGASWLLGRCWHNTQEVQCILVGLALVAAMPIAGSSTAWSQNSEGNLALSLGLVLGSTFLSPLTTPAVLHSASLVSSGEYAERLRDLAGHGTGSFLTLCVFLPALVGMLVRQVLGEERAIVLRPWVKRVNAVNLLVLCYSNAAVSLPEAVGNPDLDFVVVMLGLVAGLCLAAFGAGWLLGRWLGVDAGERTALMFGLGMNNNGTGLVLASLALAGYPRVMQPVILYNLVQHLVAATVGARLRREPASKASRQAA